MLTCNMPRVNTIKDSEMQQLAEFFGVDYRKDFFEFVKQGAIHSELHLFIFLL